MSKRHDSQLLNDIIESISRIEIYIQQLSYDNFKADLKTQDAVIRNLEIIGEASKAISEKLKSDHSDIPWKKMAGIRDHLIHNYAGVNLDIVWNVVSQELGKVKEALVHIS